MVRYPQMYPQMALDLTVLLRNTKDKNSNGYLEFNA